MRFLREGSASADRSSGLRLGSFGGTHTCPRTGRASPAVRDPRGLAESSVLGIAVSDEWRIVSTEGLPCRYMFSPPFLLYSKSVKNQSKEE